MLLKFKEWDNSNPIMNESAPLEKIVNWLSSNFGGSVSEIDGLLSKVSSIETQYVQDWNDIQTDIDSLEVRKAQTKADAAELKKLERMIDRNRKLLVALQRKKKADLDKIDTKAEKIIGNKSRLVSYWNLKKAELESDIAEKLYKLSKDLTDESIADDLYDKYKDAALNAKKKDEAFREKFGKLDLAKSSVIDNETESITRSNFSLDPILAMNAVQFTKYVQGLEKTQVKDLIRFITRERNEKYATLDTEKDRLKDQAKKKGLSDDSVSSSISDLRETLMEQIRDLRTKITIARRYA
jgi:hypothetical protein